MSDKDVRLIIRAKNQASKEINTVKDAIEAFNEAASDLQQEVKGPLGALSKLGTEFKKLQAQITVGNALAKVSGFMDKAATSLENVRREASQTGGDLDKARAASDRLQASTAELAKELAEVQSRLAASRQAQKEAAALSNRDSDAKRRLTKATQDLNKARGLSEKNPQRQFRVDTASAEVAAAQKALDANKAATDAAKVQTKALAAEEERLADALKVANREVRQSENQVSSLTAKLASVTAEVGRAETTFEELAAITRNTAGSIGVVDTNADSLAASVARLVPEAQRLGNALNTVQKFSAGAGQFADPKSAARLREQRETVEQAEQAWRELEAVVKQTAQQMKASDSVTAEQERQFRELVGAARAAKDEYNSQVAALAKLKGSTEGTFATFVQGNAKLRSLTANYERNRQAVADLTNAVGRYAAAGSAFAPGAAKAIQAQSKAVEEAEQRFRLLSKAADDMRNALASQSTVTAEQTSRLNVLAGAAQQAQKEFEEQGKALADLTGKYDSNVQALNTLNAAVNRYATGTGIAASAQLAGKIREQVAVVKEAEDRYRLLAEETERLNAAFQRGGGATAEQAQRLRLVAAATQQAEREFNEAGRALRGLMQEQQRSSTVFSRAVAGQRESLSLYQRLRGEILSLAASYVGFFAAFSGAGAVVSAFQKIEAAQTRLGVVVNGDQSQIASEMGFVSREARRLGIEFGLLSDQYSKFAISASRANFTGDATRQVFSQVAEAARVTKLSIEDTEGVFLALNQIIQKGKVSSEELRGQIGERLPGAFNIFAEALGVTTQELDKMLQQGEVFATQDTLVKFGNRLEEVFGPSLQGALIGTTAEIGRFQNNLFEAAARVGEGGFIRGFTKLLAELNGYLESREGRDFFLSLGAAAERGLGVVSLFAQNIGSVLNVVKALVAVKVVTWILGMTQAQNGAVASALQWARANVGLAATTTSLGTTTQTVRGQIAAFSASVVTAAQSLTVARARMLATSTATGVFRAGMVGAAAAARAFYVAVGGIPGILTAIATYLATEIFASWISGVDEVTQGLDEHKQFMDDILGRYDQVTDKTDKWAEALKNVTLDQLEGQLAKRQSELDAARKAVRDTVSGNGADLALIGGAAGGYSGTIRNVQALVKQMQAAGKSAAELEKALLKVYEGETNNDAKQFIRTILEQVRAQGNVERAVGQTADALGKKRAAVAGVDGALRGVKGPLDVAASATSNLAAALGDGTGAAGEFKTALEGIADFVPSLKNELDKLADTKKLDEYVKMLMQFGPLTKNQLDQIAAARNGIDAKYTNYGAQYTSRIGSPEGRNDEELVRQTTKLAAEMGLAAKDLLAVFSYETGGKLRTDVRGGAGGNYLGLIQFSPANQKRYGVNAGNTIEEQVKAAGKYLQDAGVKAGDSLNRIYAAINTGSPNKTSGVSDAGNGGRPGDVNFKIENDFPGHLKRAEALLETYGGVAKEQEKLVDKQKDQAEEAEKQKKATDERLAGIKEENAQEQLKLDGKAREAAIEKEIAEARKENPAITAKQIEDLRREAGLRYDKQNALTAEEQSKQKITGLNEKINALEEQRTALLEQQKVYQEQGNTEKLQETQAALAGINTQLIQAIDNAIAYQQTLGGDKAAAAIAQLNAQKFAIQNADAAGQKFAFTATQMSDAIYNSLDTAVVNSFDALAQAIARGEDAGEALFTALCQGAADFLLMLGKMIIQQTLFNTLQNASKALGGGLFSFLSFHTGGVVGAAGEGGTRMVNPGVFSAAVRYHTGGIGGLAPDEVPAILQEGEEILTEQDARHRNNLGKRGSGGRRTRIINAFDSASFLQESMNQPVGEETILNYVRANPAAFKQALDG